MNVATKPFFVFLRSLRNDFETDERLRFLASSRLWGKTKVGAPKIALSHLLEAAGPLIEIGYSQGGGVGRLMEPDEAWWNTAVAAIIHATAIFISPGLTENLLREVTFVLSNDIISRRSFIIMEPAAQNLTGRSSKRAKLVAEDRINRWRLFCRHFQKHGYDLPEYNEGGAIISLYDFSERVPFIGLSRYELYDFMHKFYVDLYRQGSYDIAPQDSCPCGSGKMFARCHQL